MDYGLRRITFLIAQEVSLICNASYESFLFSKTQCHSFDIYSVDWSGRDQLLEKRWLSKWVILEADGVIVKNKCTNVQMSLAWFNCLLYGFLFAERISQVFHIQSKRWGMTESNICSLSSDLFWHSGRISLSSRYSCVLEHGNFCADSGLLLGFYFQQEPCISMWNSDLTPPALSAFATNTSHGQFLYLLEDSVRWSSQPLLPMFF